MWELEELIDTLWNVNLDNYKTTKPVSRINRYIMECKSTLFGFWNFGVKGINRYIMECKYF